VWFFVFKGYGTISFMQFTKIQKIMTSGIIIAILLGAYIIFDRRHNEVDESISKDDMATTTIMTKDGAINIVGPSGSYTIKQVPEEKNIPIPDLNRKVIFGSGVTLSLDVRKILADKIVALQTSLKKDSKNITTWIDLGIYQKQIGDYDGAILSWKYASDISNDFVSLYNLANLYAYYLKDKGLAEVYYKQAIARGPTQVYLYTQLAEAYRDVFNDLSKARAVIEEGLKKNPNDKTLLEFKENLK